MEGIPMESDPLVQEIKNAVRGVKYSCTYSFPPHGTMLSKDFGDISQKIKSMAVRPDDIWIVTFPKTGTTVIQEAVWLLKNNLNAAKAKEVPLTLRVPFLEARVIDLALDGFPSVDEFDGMPSPRIIKSHLPLSLLPDALWTVEPKVIVTYRNPKDVVISFYHHSKLLLGNESSFEEFAEWFLNDKYKFSPFWPMILELWEKRLQPNVHFVLFEDIVKNPRDFVRSLKDFLGVTLPPKDEENLLEHLSFKRMRSNPSINYEKIITQRSKEDGKFVRSGKIDEWKERMSQEMINRFDAWSSRFLKDSNFPLYY